MRMLRITRMTLLWASLFFVISSCNKEPECSFSNCINGQCIDGSCLCDEGYEGLNCDEEKSISSARVKSITLFQFPTAGYDVGNNPDVYVNIQNINEQNIWSSPNYVNNAQSGAQYTFPVNTTIQLDPDADYILRFYDYDTPDADDDMGGIIFSVNGARNGMSKYIDLQTNNYFVTVEVQYTYFW